MKFCVDCKYYAANTIAFCEAPQNGISPITGKIDYTIVDFQRTKGGGCGLEGDWFVERKPFWKFWTKS